MPSIFLSPGDLFIFIYKNALLTEGVSPELAHALARALNNVLTTAQNDDADTEDTLPGVTWYDPTQLQAASPAGLPTSPPTPDLTAGHPSEALETVIGGDQGGIEETPKT